MLYACSINRQGPPSKWPLLIYRQLDRPPLLLYPQYVMRPYGCIEDNPTPQSIIFCGVAINLKEMSRLHGFDHGYLSKIFSYKRIPSMDYAKKIADALHMNAEDLIKALQLEKKESLSRIVE